MQQKGQENQILSQLIIFNMMRAKQAFTKIINFDTYPTISYYPTHIFTSIKYNSLSSLTPPQNPFSPYK